MGTFYIKGGNTLNGEVSISGSKNSALPILASTLLVRGVSVIENCPNISDVNKAIDILRMFKCDVEFYDNKVIVNSEKACLCEIPPSISEKMRSSIVFMGASLGRFNEVVTGYPGGCEIGERPIDFHIKAFSKMGVCFEEFGCCMRGFGKTFEGSEINLDFPSVGATENIMILASVSLGETVIYNAAKEPEIVDLQNFLNKAGADIKGAGTDIIYIKGVEKLKGTDYKIISDRIEAGTFLCAVAATGGKLFVKNGKIDDMRQTVLRLLETGCIIKEYNDGIYIERENKLKPINIIRTEPYPGFPTDMQPQIMSVLTLAKGTSIIIETVFEARFKHILDMCKMGADISFDGRIAVIKGVDGLKGSFVNCRDLRGGAGLIIAGLAAEGETFVDNSVYVERGYENIDDKLRLIGGNIKLLK